MQSALTGSGVVSADTGVHAVQPSGRRQTVSAAFLTLRIIGYLVLLLVILVAGTWLIKKIGMAGKSKIGGGAMDIIEALPLGQGKNLALVRVLDKVYVLGQTNQQITLLDTFTGQQALTLIAQSREIVSITQFKDVFRSFMEKFKK
ncbi:MAG: flagellar biosynthetic protein FliO [Chitinivibrionales bacterium]|nr:flagellar biosynthetic protein FliO [Chitinivibrionales bacterium]